LRETGSHGETSAQNRKQSNWSSLNVYQACFTRGRRASPVVGVLHPWSRAYASVADFPLQLAHRCWYRHRENLMFNSRARHSRSLCSRYPLTVIRTNCLPAFPTVTVETVTTLAGVTNLQPEYERLRVSSGCMLPFSLYEWHLTWCRYFLGCNPHIQDEPLFYILRNFSGACVAILPLIVSRRHLGPVKIVSISLLGADPAITEIRTPMVESGYELLTARAAHDQLAKVSDWDWIHWSGVSDEFAEALSAAGTLRWQAPLSDFVLDLPDTWEEFRSGLKRNIRESLRHGYNSLKRDGHRFELQVATDPGEVLAGLDRFLDLHRMRANLANTVPHLDRFASKVCRNFLYAVSVQLAARGAIRLFGLKIGAEIVAMRLGFVVGDSLYLYYSGFDPAWARYGVMTTTVAEAIKYAIAQGLKTVNLSPTKDLSKSRWSPRQIDYPSAYEPGERLRSRLASSAYSRARSEGGYSSKLIQRLSSIRRMWN
jgi:CelD/BcsL family acetyltransferase involved in cellulose biosynthesis